MLRVGGSPSLPHWVAWCPDGTCHQAVLGQCCCSLPLGGEGSHGGHGQHRETFCRPFSAVPDPLLLPSLVSLQPGTSLPGVA